MLNDKKERTNEAEYGIVEEERKSRKRIGCYTFNRRVIWAWRQVMNVRGVAVELLALLPLMISSFMT